jgi:hypothetical protein
MEITPVMENFIKQVRQHDHVVSANYSEATQTHMTQIHRTDVVAINFVIKLDTNEQVPVDFVVCKDRITENSYVNFSKALKDLMTCDCVVTNETHNDRIMRDINQSAFNNTGRTTYFIRPTDGYRVSIYSEYAPVIVPTDAVFLDLIDKLKNMEHVLDITVEELLDDSILKGDEKQVKHVFFRCKHTIPGTDETRYGHFIMAETSCCVQEGHDFAIEQLKNLIEATPK